MAEALIDRYYDIDCAVSATDVPGSTQGLQLSLEAVPNPTTNEAGLHFSVPVAGDVRLALYNNVGEKVVTPNSGVVAAGDHSEVIDVSTLPAGSYVVTLEASRPPDWLSCDNR